MIGQVLDLQRHVRGAGFSLDKVAFYMRLLLSARRYTCGHAADV